MAKIKLYTDLPQSKKLSEFLSHESADMYWDYDFEKHEPCLMVMDDQFDETCVCAWSLAALLELFDDEAGLARDYGLWFCYDNEKSYSTKYYYDNPIDACYEMIIKLHELKKL